MGIRIESLSESMREQVIAKIAAEDAERARRRQQAAASAQPQPVTPEPDKKRVRETTVRAAKRREPNRTEADYNKSVLESKGRYEALSLRLPGGSRYTPDWLTLDNGRVTLHEVKGSYRFGSHGRAVTAFREAVAAFPFFRFVWAVQKRKGVFEITSHWE